MAVGSAPDVRMLSAGCIIAGHVQNNAHLFWYTYIVRTREKGAFIMYKNLVCENENAYLIKKFGKTFKDIMDMPEGRKSNEE